MKAFFIATLALLVGGGAGATAVRTLHAQGKPPIYYVVEMETSDAEAYAREFAPQAQAIITAAGGRFVAVGGVGATRATALTPVEGTPPKRAVIMVWDNMDQVHAWWNNPDYGALRKIVDKYTTFRSFTIEGQ